MNRTKVDWWAWRARGTLADQERALSAVFADAGHPVTLVPRKSGWKGYEQAAGIRVGELDAGLLAWGGENQKGWHYVSLSGAACDWVGDWDRAQEAAEACPAYDLKRVDIALDTFDGSVSFDAVEAAFDGGKFAPAGSGRPPKGQFERQKRPEDSQIARIGSRESAKYLRCYEKGKQVLGPEVAKAMRRDPESFDWSEWVGATMPLPDPETGEMKLYGVWDWFRLELELKPVSAPLPSDLIDRRDHYFAGSYPYLGEVLEGVDPEVLVMKRERMPQLELALALDNIRRQYGSTLFTALVAHHGDFGAVWQKVCGNKHNAKLVAAGVLMVDH